MNSHTQNIVFLIHKKDDGREFVVILFQLFSFFFRNRTQYVNDVGARVCCVG